MYKSTKHQAPHAHLAASHAQQYAGGDAARRTYASDPQHTMHKPCHMCIPYTAWRMCNTYYMLCRCVLYICTTVKQSPANSQTRSSREGWRGEMSTVSSPCECRFACYVCVWGCV